MTTLNFPQALRNRKSLRDYSRSVLGTARAKSRPITRHIADHLYTLAGFGCISAASFVHSVFTGLLVTGILLLVFEFKVSELWAGGSF